jgi:hypothetical protein
MYMIYPPSIKCKMVCSDLLQAGCAAVPFHLVRLAESMTWPEI